MLKTKQKEMRGMIGERRAKNAENEVNEGKNEGNSEGRSERTSGERQK